MPKTKKSWLVLALIALGVIVWLVLAFARSTPAKDQASKTTPAPSAAPEAPAFDKTAESITDPSSPWVVVNKKRLLEPRDYTPADLVIPDIPLRQKNGGEEMQLRAETATALEAMAAAAKQDGIHLMLASGYRSYNLQKTVYNRNVAQLGQAKADTESARPGHSEHQTGLVADLEPLDRSCEIQACFADTPEGKWLAAHAHEHGFIIRYPEGKQAETGYIYEPWHVRYVGKSLSAELHKTPQATLEAFFGLEKAGNY